MTVTELAAKRTTMTADLAVAISDMRLRQTAQLLEWLIANRADSHDLRRALESIDAARLLIAKLPAGS